MIDVHHCPRCELRFSSVAELADHFGRDHGVDPVLFERYHYSSIVEPAAPVVLVVANQSLTHPSVLDVALARASEGKSIVLVVPVRHRGAVTDVPAAAVDVRSAGARAEAAAAWLASHGYGAEVVIGDHDPEVALHDVLGQTAAVEVVLGTLGPGLSRWLRVDLPMRITRRFGLPVTVVEPIPASR